MHARYCSPGMGRFLSVDPVNSARPGNPQTWNKYVYGANNPAKFVDPDGESALSFGVKLLFKGGDVGLTAAGIVSDFKALTGAGSSFGGRLLAAGSLASELLPISGRDVLAIGGAVTVAAAGVFKRLDDLRSTSRLRTINSNLAHAAERSTLRASFGSEREAAEASRNFGKSIEANRLPAGTIADTVHADRIIVPGFGEGGAVVYQVTSSGKLRLRTVLEFKVDPNNIIDTAVP